MRKFLKSPTEAYDRVITQGLDFKGEELPVHQFPIPGNALWIFCRDSAVLKSSEFYLIQYQYQDILQSAQECELRYPR